MNNRNKIFIGIILLFVVLIGVVLYGINASPMFPPITRRLNENSENIPEEKLDQEEEQKQDESNRYELIENLDEEEERASKEEDSEEKDELRELFGREVFDTKEYYVDSEEVAREIIKLQGEALRKEVSGNSEVREIETRIEKNYEIEAVNLQDLDLEMAQCVEMACEYMYNRYPCLKGYLTNISVQEDFNESASVIAEYDTYTFLNTPEDGSIYPFSVKRRILLDAEEFYRPQKIKNMITRSVRDGYWRENTTVKSIFVHELAHCLVDRLVSETYGLGKSICITEENGDAFGDVVTQGLAYNQTMEKDICNTAYENYVELQSEECTYGEFCEKISGYAVGTQEDGGISYGETIAEAMTDVYINGENCTPASKAVIDEVETRLKRINLEVNETQFD